MSPLLSIDNLVVSYGTGRGRRSRRAGSRGEGEVVHAVNGVSVTVEKGQMTAIVGESGSGKSTTAKAALGLLPANATIDAGQIRFQGTDTTAYRERQWRGLRGRSIGLIPQDPTNSLNPVKTIGESVGEGLAIHTTLSRGDIRARVIDLLAKVGIDDPARRHDQYPHELSGGMNQRALIAAALALEPELIVADEPTSALDVTVQKVILDLLDEMRQDLGIGILFITHDLAVAGDRADRVVVMQNGEVRESGLAASVLSDPQDDYSRGLLADAPSLAVARVNPRPPLGDDVLVEAKDVTKDFGDFRAVDGISFEVARGSTHAIVGESGSGKTTLGRIISAFEDPTDGQVLLDGVDLGGLDKAGRRALRKRVQLVYQNPYASLDPRQRIGDIIAEPLRNMAGATRAEAAQKVETYLGRVALDPAVAARRPHELSGGQRQRVAIARALIVEPDLIVLDEAVSALDVTVQAQVLRLLNELQRELGLTYIFISHDLAVVRQISDTVSVMSQGRQVEAGPTHEVYTNPQTDFTRTLLDSIPGAKLRSGQLNLGL
ncbi:ABC transporter ATPase [Corynebacterium maris DSM 45190]|uniref:ABC transporter ATPase n=1 Tax=Corynebacterium maris DSM 45190 TaxID=1224163 RepID=S5SWF9_9CORY|nr:ABC transporter ATP-binding protein [Corynebacterium maris]AGS35544.1 ABC transporter ATPase [Corynebacterium maris DSM 45190]